MTSQNSQFKMSNPNPSVSKKSRKAKQESPRNSSSDDVKVGVENERQEPVISMNLILLRQV